LCVNIKINPLYCGRNYRCQENENKEKEEISIIEEELR